MAVARIGTETTNFAATATEWSTRVFSHTFPSGVILGIISIAFDATDPVISTVVWDVAGVNEAFTLIDATTSSGGAGDTKMETWGIISPTVKTADITITPVSGTVSQSTIGVVNYSGTKTASVAAAAIFREEVVNDVNSSTLVFASAGTAGNRLYSAGNFQDFDRDPVSLSGSWIEVLEENSATDSAEFILKIAEIDGVDSLTMTASGGADECCGQMIELVAATVGGRIMSSLVNSGGLVAAGGIAGPGGGLAG